MSLFEFFSEFVKIVLFTAISFFERWMMKISDDSVVQSPVMLMVIFDIYVSADWNMRDYHQMRQYSIMLMSSFLMIRKLYWYSRSECVPKDSKRQSDASSRHASSRHDDSSSSLREKQKIF
ncbi:hypothetical protein RCL_jg16296.t1 [Rhizophagus clarus]|uniref:Uncharacterized protein n=1 Tax=Rhizophagus clarus TaxID=94130 RepID=A0A8H3R099_9GLOM|nr:hypothetical protein RCL_jg16296.t1 [Rhizophagus clarus]